MQLFATPPYTPGMAPKSVFVFEKDYLEDYDPEEARNRTEPVEILEADEIETEQSSDQQRQEFTSYYKYEAEMHTRLENYQKMIQHRFQQISRDFIMESAKTRSLVKSKSDQGYKNTIHIDLDLDDTATTIDVHALKKLPLYFHEQAYPSSNGEDECDESGPEAFELLSAKNSSIQRAKTTPVIEESKLKQQLLRHQSALDGKRVSPARVHFSEHNKMYREVQVFKKSQEPFGAELAVIDNKGIFVVDVVQDSPAYKSGIRLGDEILAINEYGIKKFGHESLLLMMYFHVRKEFKLNLSEGTLTTNHRLRRKGAHELYGFALKEGKVSKILDGSPAEKAKLSLGQTVVEIEGWPLPAEKLKKVKKIIDKSGTRLELVCMSQLAHESVLTHLKAAKQRRPIAQYAKQLSKVYKKQMPGRDLSLMTIQELEFMHEKNLIDLSDGLLKKDDMEAGNLEAKNGTDGSDEQSSEQRAFADPGTLLPPLRGPAATATDTDSGPATESRGLALLRFVFSSPASTLNTGLIGM